MYTFFQICYLHEEKVLPIKDRAFSDINSVDHTWRQSIFMAYMCMSVIYLCKDSGIAKNYIKRAFT